MARLAAGSLGMAGGRLAALLLLAVPLAGAAEAEPFIPADDGAVIEHLPAPTNPNVRAVRRLHELLARVPDRLDVALAAARADMDLGRAEGDPRYNGRAEAALAPWLALPAPPVPVLVVRATLLQSRHEFGAALADLDRALAAEPLNAQALLTRAIVKQVRGDFDAARADCRALDRLVPALVVTVCAAGIDSLTGAGDAAFTALSAALAPSGTSQDSAIRVWGLTVLGETAARLGRAAEAEAAFRQAVALGQRDVYLLGAYADLLLDLDRNAEAASLLEAETRIDPLLLRLAIAEQRLGRPSFGAHAADLAERFASARRRGDATHRREEARFTIEILHRPRAALDLALANWAVQREPWDARLVLATALAADAAGEAAPVLQWIANTKLQDLEIAGLVTRFGAKS